MMTSQEVEHDEGSEVKSLYLVELVDDWKINGGFIEIIVRYFSTYT